MNSYGFLCFYGQKRNHLPITTTRSYLPLMIQNNWSIDERPSHASNLTWTRRLTVMFLLMAFSVGCSRNRFPRDPNMVPISGVVTVDGEPVQHMKVILANPEHVEQFKMNKRVAIPGPSGMTDEKGAFAITSVHLGDGVLPGEYSVVFDWVPPGSEELFLDNVPTELQLADFPKKLLPIHEKYFAGGEGVIKGFKVEAKKPQKDVKFDLTTK